MNKQIQITYSNTMLKWLEMITIRLKRLKRLRLIAVRSPMTMILMHTGPKVNGETAYQRRNNDAMILYCNLCDEPIKFNDEHISERTGKKIPLDPGIVE